MLPPRLLPILYVGTAHLSLTLAFACVAWRPRAIVGFFYNPWMITLVHLVTLGWITLSILGVLYIVGPMALRMQLPARRGDYVAYALSVIGVGGMVSHFWIQEFSGMAWSAAAVACGILCVMARVVPHLRGAPIPGGVKLHIALAGLNVLVAAAMGTLLGFDRMYHFLPGFILTNVLAHAHLAALGWATMMVIGVGYRLLPMVLPASAPRGPSLYASAVLLETGVTGLFVTLLIGSAWSRLWGVVIVGALVAFGAHVVGMMRERRGRPAALPKPDFAVWHAASAGLCLIAAVALGLVLLFEPWSDWTLRAARAYGVFGLVGFLAQMVVGMEIRVLPMFASYHAVANAGHQGEIASPHAMGSQASRAIVFALWAIGVPGLAAGLSFEVVPLVGAAGLLLFVSAVIASAHTAAVLRQAVSVRPQGLQTATSR